MVTELAQIVKIPHCINLGIQMETIVLLIQEYGIYIVITNVFLEQIGAPVPAFPTLLLTGALIGQNSYSTTMLFIAAVTAAVLADFIWYLNGRKYGHSVIKRICQISLSPDSCVKKTESIYLKIGPSALLFCKFIPGFASVSSALAGTLGTKVVTF
jgi:membrane protein DedA with SNARE-associated domain